MWFPQTGRRIAAAAGGQLTPCVLELGGTSANIVVEDADLSRAAGGAAAAIFPGAGQSCVAGSRLLIQSSVYDEVIERVATLAASIRQGDPFDQQTQVGPVQNAAQLGQVMSMVNAALDGSAQAVVGGSRRDRPGYFGSPDIDVGQGRCAIASGERGAGEGGRTGGP